MRAVDEKQEMFEISVHSVYISSLCACMVY